MRVLGHRRAPAVEHGGEADARTKVLAIGRNRKQRLGGCAEDQLALFIENAGDDNARHHE